MGALAIKPSAHVVDVLGNVIGRDQPILRMEKALEMVSLLGEEVFADDDVVFFDPFCKAGELLLACAFRSCWAKSKGQFKLLDMDMVFKEIYESNRYFGLAPDERHHRLSVRTFLGNTHSHDENFNHIIRDGHYLSEEDGTLDKEKFEKEFKSMIEFINSKAKNKRIIAVGNPPYQEEDGGAGASSKQIYPFFVEKLMDTEVVAEFIFVIKAAWFSSGKGTKPFRDRIVNSRGIKNIKYFVESEEVFPTVHIQGGVCYLNWNREHNSLANFDTGKTSEMIDLSALDIIPDDPLAIPIIKKIQSKHDGIFVSDVAWSRKPFGLPTNYFSTNPDARATDPNVLRCLVKGRKVKHLKKSAITVRADKVNDWKVAIPKAYATGDRRCTLPKHQIFLLDKETICTETYNIISTFKTKSEAEQLIKYLQTDFCRYLLGLRKLTQDIPKDKWSWVPHLDLDRISTESEIYKHFDITKAEQAHIVKMVQEWS